MMRCAAFCSFKFLTNARRRRFNSFTVVSSLKPQLLIKYTNPKATNPCLSNSPILDDSGDSPDLNGDAQRLGSSLDPSLVRLHGSSGCFGCCTKPTPIIAVDEPSKGLKIQGRTVKKPGISDDFWSSSTYDLDNSAVQSQRSISSISISNQTLLHATTSSHSDFVNQGLVLWNQTRLEWIGSGKPKSETHKSRENRLSWNTTYERLVGPKQRQPFPQRIPLSEMIEFLVEVWEQEGLYD